MGTDGMASIKPSYDVLIVGAGHAGVQAAASLRQMGYAGSVGLAGDEPDLPYERPPLSKEYLAGEKPFERIVLKPAAFYSDRDIDLLSGQRVISVDAAAKCVTLMDGSHLRFGALIWAAGGSPRRLACDGGNLVGTHTVRTRADIDRLQSEMAATKRVVIIGGGYIGLEAAAALSKADKQITVLETQDRVLARVAAEPLSRFYEAEHRAHGVEVRLGMTVRCIEGKDGHVCGVRLDDGTLLRCEMVIVGIGIRPAVDALLAAGAEAAEGGVLVDEHCRTSLENVYAVGDCAAHRNVFANGRTIRLESVQNANDQATTAAKAIVGDPTPYRVLPWFWSNQFDLKLQTVGLSLGCDEVLVRGDLTKRSFSVGYLRNNALIAIDCVNSVRDYVQAKALILSAIPIDRERFIDSSISLKDINSTMLK